MSSTEPATEGVDSGVYLLNRDWSSSARLSFQHWIIKLREGWLLHPKIKDAIMSPTTTTNVASPALRIADVAAGNCIWSMEVLTEFPNAEITAFDLSTEAFPTEVARPSSLHLETWNIFEPIAERYLGYFDIVHIRFMVGVLHKGGHETVIKSLASMLKPGGWIQWQDAEPPGIGPINAETLEPIPPADWPSPIKFFGEQTGVWEGSGWMYDLDKSLRDIGGCVDTELYRAPFKRETLKYETDGAPWLYHELLRGPMAKLLDTEEGKKKRQELAEQMDKEIDLIAKGERVWAYNAVVAVGRKPSVV